MISTQRPPANIQISIGSELYIRWRRTQSYSNKRILCQSAKSNGGLRILEWTGSVVPQGLLVKTAKYAWRQAWLTLMKELAPQNKSGGYSRPTYTFQNPIGSPEFPEESGRYVLYLGNPCPWCHRVLMTAHLKGLLNNNSDGKTSSFITVVRALDDPERASRGGWVFKQPEPAFGCTDLRQVYDLCTPGNAYKGRCTAPLLIDKISRKIVCNDSGYMIRNLNSIQYKSGRTIDLCPKHMEYEIDMMNALTYESINNGVYKSGFATTQQAYDEAQHHLYTQLEYLDNKLASSRFLCGDKFTEADVRVYPTAVRFDAVYAVLFKCSAKQWSRFPNLSAWLKDCSSIPLPFHADNSSNTSAAVNFDTHNVYSSNNTQHMGGIILLDTVDVDDCRRSYFSQLFPLNPSNIVPSGPKVADLNLLDVDNKPADAESVFYFTS